jgi:hypothetical protein
MDEGCSIYIVSEKGGTRSSLFTFALSLFQDLNYPRSQGPFNEPRTWHAVAVVVAAAAADDRHILHQLQILAQMEYQQ